MKAIIDIQPHEDGVHCGECEEYELEFCNSIPHDSGIFELAIRGESCLAATKEIVRIMSEHLNIQNALVAAEGDDLVEVINNIVQQRDAALELLREVDFLFNMYVTVDDDGYLGIRKECKQMRDNIAVLLKDCE